MSQDFWSIKSILRATVVISILMLGAAFYFRPIPSFVGGVFSGSAVGLVNFVLLRRFVVKLVSADQAEVAKRGLFYVAKVVLLIALIGFLIIKMQMDAMGFAIGFSAIVLGIFFEGFRAVF